MTQPKHIKVIAIDGQPYGRFVNPFAKFWASLLQPDWVRFEAYADKHQHPFPGAIIGDVIEADKVEVVWQIQLPFFKDDEWEDVLESDETTGVERRTIYRLKQHSMSQVKATDNGHNEIAISLMRELLYENGCINKLEPDSILRYPQDHVERIAVASAEFFDSNPDLLTDEVINDIVSGEQSENEAKYGNLNGYYKLMYSLELFFNVM